MKKANESLRHSIPTHYFEKGKYEVWAKKGVHDKQLTRIASELTLETAKDFQRGWNGEIRLHGVVVA